MNNSIHKGNDFDDLANIYVESYNFEKKKDEDDEDKDKDEETPVTEAEDSDEDSEDEDKETVSESSDDEDSDEDEDEKEDTLEEAAAKCLEEGFFDRVKARASGAVDSVKQMGSNVKQVGKAVVKGGEFETKNPSDRYASSKNQSIVNTHLGKIQKELSAFATDLAKLGILEDAAAEQMASKSFSALKMNPAIANIIKKGKM
tara:strand:- start:57 stop:662 length:606 start_codon:yes stop_codon:yes gene_type:complete